ncbi:MAG: hypothetical protein JWP81_410 [Ferruginibacter sp.]|nr:hypothetical protein [Ferruginibacter sp.]
MRLFFYLVFTCVFCCPKLQAQQTLWNNIENHTDKSYTTLLKDVSPGSIVFSKLDLGKLSEVVRNAPLERTDGVFTKGIPFSLPLPDKTILLTSIAESPIWDARYAAQLNNVKTYVLSDPITKSSRGRITITSEGVSGIIFSDKGDVYISPVNSNEPGAHMLYYTKDENKTMIGCNTKAGATVAANKPANITSGDNKRRTYRLAVAATAEYTAWAGSQDNARNYLTITINNIIAIYDRDLNIRFTIVTPNSILFTDATTDPYPGPTAALDDALLDANQLTLDTYLGTGGYDVGIVLSRGWEGRYALNGTVCNAATKAKSAAGLSTGQGLNPVRGPQGFVFDLAVAHQIGHQFNATHSFASNAGSCNTLATADAAFEPGSGSSLMSYGGILNCNTYVNNVESYFHAGSIAQIQSYVIGAGNCVTPVSTGNNAPVVSVAAVSYNVPVSTPFTLSASGSDADGNALVYNWEQMDVNFLTATPPAATNTQGPNFRSYPPTSTGNNRTFPKINDIVAGISPAYEVLPSAARTMNFRITARDQSPLGGCTSEANVAVNFNGGSGPFIVTSQNSAITWAANGSQVIAWNVAATNIAPVNCTNVDILFSTDGGLTYPYTLASNTSNDGTETISVPNLSTQAGRIKVQAVNNIFFNINTANITIVSTCAAEGATITPSDSINASAGCTSLNLSLSPQYGTVATISGSITSASPSTVLVFYNTSTSSCGTSGFNNSYKYSTHSFVVTAAGSFTFTPSPVSSSSGLIYNLYRESFDPAFPCNNFITSNVVAPPTTVSSSISTTLLPGRYVLVAGTFSSTVALPYAYSVAVTGGSIYSNPPDPGGAYSYMYVVIDKSTSLIKSIASTADLSNSTSYPGGKNYTVYGLSYSNTSPSLASFVGTNFNTLTDALLNNPSYCGNLSKNFFTVNIFTSATYTFTGNGNWDVQANWANNSIPPSPLPKCSAIVIDPVIAGECILNVPMSIPQGNQLTVQAGKTFRILGNLTIQQ